MRAAIKKRRRSQAMFRTHSEIWLVSDHPVRSPKEASRYLLTVAATPPLGGGEYLAQKSLSKKPRRYLSRAFVSLCLCVYSDQSIISLQRARQRGCPSSSS